MPVVKPFRTDGDNYLRKTNTDGDLSKTSVIQHYEKQNGSDGASSNTVFTLTQMYVVGSNTLMVFVNGQKAELLVSATDGTEYEETGISTVTFGASLLDADVVEFIIVGTYALQDGELYYPKTESLRKNLIINGDMRVAQRGTSFTGLTELGSGTFTLDRWAYWESGTSDHVITITQDSDTPTGEGFASSMKIDVTTAETEEAANGTVYIAQGIEGQDLQHLKYGTANAMSTVFSFWLKSDTKTGTFTASIRNTDAARSYPIDVVVADNNWNKYTYVIPGDTVSGFTNDNTVGLRVQFNPLVGSSHQGTGETWQAGTYHGTANADNFFDHTDNNIWITGAQWEVGGDVTPFERRSYAEEFLLCARYFLQYNMGSSGYPFGIAHAANTTSLRCSMWTPVPLRTDPTLSNTFGYYGNGTFKSVGTISNAIAYTWGFTFLDTNTGLTQYEVYTVVPTATPTGMTVDAEI